MSPSLDDRRMPHAIVPTTHNLSLHACVISNLPSWADVRRLSCCRLVARLYFSATSCSVCRVACCRARLIAQLCSRLRHACNKFSVLAFRRLLKMRPFSSLNTFLLKRMAHEKLFRLSACNRLPTLLWNMFMRLLLRNIQNNTFERGIGLP